MSLKEGEIKNKIKIPKFNKTEHCDQTIYSNQMSHFVSCTKSRKQPTSGISEGQIVLNIVDAAFESAESGSVVHL